MCVPLPPSPARSCFFFLDTFKDFSFFPCFKNFATLLPRLSRALLTCAHSSSCSSEEFPGAASLIVELVSFVWASCSGTPFFSFTVCLFFPIFPKQSYYQLPFLFICLFLLHSSSRPPVPLSAASILPFTVSRVAWVRPCALRFFPFFLSPLPSASPLTAFQRPCAFPGCMAMAEMTRGGSVWRFTPYPFSLVLQMFFSQLPCWLSHPHPRLRPEDNQLSPLSGSVTHSSSPSAGELVDVCRYQSNFLLVASVLCSLVTFASTVCFSALSDVGWQTCPAGGCCRGHFLLCPSITPHRTRPFRSWHHCQRSSLLSFCAAVEG